MKSLNKKLSLFIALMLLAPMVKAGTIGAVISDQSLLYLLVSAGLILLILVVVLANVIKGFAKSKKIWEYLKEKRKAATVITIGLLLTAGNATAQTATGSSAFVMSSTLFWALLTLDLILVVVVLYLFRVLRQLLGLLKGEEEVTEEPSVIASWTASLTDAVPLENEEDILMDHEYDGIRELDNSLPPWWVWGFYFTIAFAFVYLFYYQFLGGPSSSDEYYAEMNAAKTEQEANMASAANSIDETNVEYLTDATTLDVGKKIFDGNCAACHGTNAASNPSGVGPNLVDEYWMHGGGIKNIFKTIKYGVPAKGMISWEAQLSPSQIQKVSSYIWSLQGSIVEGGKEPQGDKYIEEALPEMEASVEGDESQEKSDSTVTDSTVEEEVTE